jgi:hypothetical protein
VRYPSLEQYAEALQHPPAAILDPVLHGATVQGNAFGLPVPISGGFAVTFRCAKGKKAFAFRCFHRYVESLERRYDAISSTLVALKSPYTVDFQYCRRGVRVNGREYPAVRMEWVQGSTLGEFLTLHHRDSARLEVLAESVRRLATYLEAHGIAHGDIQPGNLMVSADGSTLKVIDYDGMYVPSLAGAGASEDGQINFQHPDRRGQWSPHLDRFAFSVLWLAIKSLAIDPSLWDSTQSDSDAVLLRANDFRSPSGSETFRKISLIKPLACYVEGLAGICAAPFGAIPDLEAFIKHPPRSKVLVVTGPVSQSTPYVAPYPVLNAANYTACLRHQGERVEIIGRIVDVKEALTRRGKRPYVFINFGDWRGEIVKIAIWSHGLDVLPQQPGPAWKGRWVSCVGLLEPPFENKKYGYRHLSVSVTQAGQLTCLPEHVAHFRLGLHPAGASNQSHVSPLAHDAQSITSSRPASRNPPNGAAPHVVTGANSTSSAATTMPPRTSVPSRPRSTPQAVGLPPVAGPAMPKVGQGKSARVLFIGLVVVAISAAWFLPRSRSKPAIPKTPVPASEGGRSPQRPAGPARTPRTTAPTSVNGLPQRSQHNPPKGPSAKRPRTPLSKSEIAEQLAAVRKKAEGIRENAYAFVRGSEPWVINEARAAMCMLEEADLRGIAGKGAATEAETRRLREQALVKLVACARQVEEMNEGKKDKEQLRAILAVIHKQIAEAYADLGQAQEASKYRVLAEQR